MCKLQVSNGSKRKGCSIINTRIGLRKLEHCKRCRLSDGNKHECYSIIKQAKEW